MEITVGFTLPSGWIVSELFDGEHLDAYWLTCPRCHGRMFATTQMIAENNVPACKECISRATTEERRIARNQEAEQMIAAGRDREPAYEKLIAEERAEQDAQMLRRLNLYD